MIDQRFDNAIAPYPGLRYYNPNQSKFFAARDKDIVRCYHIFVDSAILILHGTTGCGKSSFLRAGLKPHLEKARGFSPFGFDEDGELQVIRSGSDPLDGLLRHIWREFAACIEALENGEELHGGEVQEDIEDVFEQYERNENVFVKEVLADPEALIDALVTFENSVEEPPAIVIDQAEEVFTLNSTYVDQDTNKTIERSAEQIALHTEAYFKMLGLLAAAELSTKFIISLRTEYKGQFDDRLEAHITKTRDFVKGFHLPDLDEEGLKDGIIRPTELDLDANGPRFKYADGVPEYIVEKLMEDIPQGGRLPILQVACLRLWRRMCDRIAFHYKSTGEMPESWTIERLDVDLLGSFDTQIRDYLRDRLREMLDYGQDGESNRGQGTAAQDQKLLELGTRAEEWMVFFHQTLVDAQADGRTVTRKVANDELKKKIEDERGGEKFTSFGAPTSDPNEIGNPSERLFLDWLARDDVGILRKQITSTESTFWMLGHDSLGLTLERYQQSTGHMMQSMMSNMDMDMDTDLNFGSITDESSDDENKEALSYFQADFPERDVIVPEDLLWDRYLIQFAMTKKFARKLRINFHSPEGLAALSKDQSTGLNWKELMARLELARKGETEAEDGSVIRPKEFADGPDLPPVLFICERNNIVPPELCKNWHDIAIANEFVGNALVGPEIKGLEPLSVFNGSRTEYLASQRPRLQKILEHIVKTKSEIIFYDIASISAFELAARLCDFPDQEAITAIALKGKDEILKSTEIRYSSKDFLFSEMYSKDEERREREERGEGAPYTFIMGSDYGRAVASQTGFKTYFSRQDLVYFQALKKREKRQPEAAPLNKADDDLLNLRTTTHAVWNLGYADGQKRDLELEYRLAALAFFVSEYVRRNPMEFVTYLYNTHDVLRRYHDGFPVSQEIIAETFQQCFNLYHFENYGRLFYSHESPQRYWAEEDSELAAHDSRSIYYRMQDMRSRCVQQFKTFEQMRSTSSVNITLKDEADKLGEMAWRNYDRQNFFDAERQIGKAIELLDNYIRNDEVTKAVQIGQ